MSSQQTRDNTTRAERTVSNETILKIAKEITVKFIEVGRITPSSFDESFKDIYTSIQSTVTPKQ